MIAVGKHYCDSVNYKKSFDSSLHLLVVYSHLAPTNLSPAGHLTSRQQRRKMPLKHTLQRHTERSEVQTGKDCNRAHAQCCRKS